jgi:S-(hydroxymethyl)glutathione synthase
MKNFTLHPAIKRGPLNSSLNGCSSEAAGKTFSGGKLYCHCPSEKVEVTITRGSSHNHLCGCSACWKPAGALFSQVAVVPTDSLEVTKNSHKLAAINTSGAIERYACKSCLVHMYGRVNDPDHHYFGTDFVHLELADNAGSAEIEFAGYVSSLIESGVKPSDVIAIRDRLAKQGLAFYDTLSPELMDVIAYHKRKVSLAGQF